MDNEPHSPSLCSDELTSIIATSMDGFLLVDLSGQILETNQSYCLMTGYSRSELLQMHVSTVDAVDSNNDVARRVESIIQQGHLRFETKHLHKNGKIIDVEVSANFSPSHGGSIFSFIRDTSQQNRIRRTMAARLRLFEFSFNNPLDKLLRKTLDEVEELTNSCIGFYHFMDSDKQELTLQAWSTNTASKFCKAEGSGSHYHISNAGVWVDCVREKRPVIHNDYASLPHRKGMPEGHATVVRELVVPVFRGDKIVAILGVGNKTSDYDEQDIETITLLADLAWDIAEHKKMEEEKEALESQLSQSQKLESIGRLAGGVAHDFNNMLSVILGHAELGILHLDPQHPVISDLNIIRATAERSADLTRQLLAFARKQTISPKVINLNEVVASMVKMLQRLIGEDIKLDWSPSPGLWPIKMDVSQIDQVLANLCVNARDAITGTGTISIETENCVLDDAYCQTHLEAVSGKYIRLTISDNGAGMNKETLSHIFEPFFTTKELGKGTGLGLATVYGAVKQNKGFIDVCSEQGVGTTFEIYLPGYEDVSESVSKEETEKSLPHGHEAILLVEDESAILTMVSTILLKLGYTVYAASTAEEAIQLSKQHVGNIHLLLTDVIMPNMNGRDLANVLLDSNPGIKHLFMSGYTDDVIAHHGLLDEGAPFIQKPFSIDALALKLRQILDGNEHPSQ